MLLLWPWAAAPFARDFHSLPQQNMQDFARGGQELATTGYWNETHFAITNITTINKGTLFMRKYSRSLSAAWSGVCSLSQAWATGTRSCVLAHQRKIAVARLPERFFQPAMQRLPTTKNRDGIPSLNSGFGTMAAAKPAVDNVNF